MPTPLPVADQVARAVHGFVADVKRTFGSRLHQVILYGSAARGTMGDDSDIDVLVVVDLPREQARRILVDLAYPYLRPGVMFTSVPVTPSEWEAMRAERRPFATSVEREGIVLAGDS